MQTRALDVCTPKKTPFVVVLMSLLNRVETFYKQPPQLGNSQMHAPASPYPRFLRSHCITKDIGNGQRVGRCKLLKGGPVLVDMPASGNMHVAVMWLQRLDTYCSQHTLFCFFSLFPRVFFLAVLPT